MEGTMNHCSKTPIHTTIHPPSHQEAKKMEFDQVNTVYVIYPFRLVSASPQGLDWVMGYGLVEA